jgi:hypothetical protein
MCFCGSVSGGKDIVTLFRDITVDYVAVRIKTKFGTSGQR